MKKMMFLLMAVSLLGLSGCGRSMNDVIGKEPKFVGIVETVMEDSIIVAVNEDEEIYEQYPVLMVPLDVEIKDSYLEYSVGDEVVVYYDGNITVGEPTVVDTVYALTLRTPAGRATEKESSPDSVAFEAEILEVKDGYFLVEPVEGSWELNSADQIEVPVEHLDAGLEPQAGDVIKITYNGEIQESYPARISEVFGIEIVEEADTITFHDQVFNKSDLSQETIEWLEKYNTLTEEEQLAISGIPADLYELCGYPKAGEVEAEEHWDMPPMVMVDGELYLTTGYESTAEGRCGVMDGQITSTVEGWEKPTEDDQSNFGIGYGYQYGSTDGTIEIYMNEKWWIYATEEVREDLQFTE